MTSRDFCYWLQGLFELSETKTLSEQQVQIIRNHLAMVFYHEIDPSFPEEQQEELTNIHYQFSEPTDSKVNFTPSHYSQPRMKC